MLAEAHRGTRFAMEGLEQVVRTWTGTRPGNPLADLVCNIAFSYVLAQVRSEMMTNGVGSRIAARDGGGFLDLDAQQHALMEVSYVGDVAFMVSSESALELEDKLSTAACIARSVLRQRGLAVNFAKGKTAAVVRFASSGSKGAASKLYHGRAGRIPTSGTDEVLWVVATYKHLGSRSKLVALCCQKLHTGMPRHSRLW